MVWSNKDNTYDYEIMTQKVNVNKITNLNQIDIYNKNYDKINTKEGEFYIFINIGNQI